MNISSIIVYLLKSLLTAAILTGYYWMALRGKKMHRYNRFYLLSAIVLSVVLPLGRLPGWATKNTVALEIGRVAGEAKDRVTGGMMERVMSGVRGWITRITDSGGGVATGPSVDVGATIDPVKAGGLSGGWQRGVFTGTILVSITLAGRSVFKITGLLRLKKNIGYTRMEGYDWIVTRLKEAPFSFLNNLFWRAGLADDDENGKRIKQHELAHIRQKHGWDALLAETAICICWMNPFLRILQRELKMVHEFLADEAAVPEGDIEAFSRLVLSSCNAGVYLSLVQGLAHSPVKRRLLMIAGGRKISRGNWRKIVVLPVAVLLMLLFSLTSGGWPSPVVGPASRQLLLKQNAEREYNKKRAEILEMRRAGFLRMERAVIPGVRRVGMVEMPGVEMREIGRQRHV